MIIEEALSMPEYQRGRPATYPFGKLLPGQKLSIDILGKSTAHRQKQNISSALYQYKKFNKLDWLTAVRIEDKKIVVYRIK